ncbi:hypothetical protein [Mahella australiensis]|uniref:Holin n=1 Tax=Mahella australiensis (strain DSM 15567 / CIP 107919 / 50-1 BON) TaxID=697281 RepID=F3ZVC5_MAHA5|nr:hypothetical protein [Mahella australiensis]AEE95275.1 hypothetical protein Mahau_0052 [Mahella australiensis 50-1 BON]
MGFGFDVLDTLLIPIIVGISEAIKAVGVPAKHIPFIAMALGVIGSFFVVDAEVPMKVLLGIGAGLTACGLFDAGKQAVKMVKSE